MERKRTIGDGWRPWLMLVCLLTALTSPRAAEAKRWLAGILNNGVDWGLVEFRRPNFHHSGAFLKGSFRCHGNGCYALVGRFTEDNTTYPSTGSFVFYGRGPHRELIQV